MTTQANITKLIGNHLVGPDGDEVGTVEEIYNDDRTGMPAWARVKTGRFGAKDRFVPLDGVRTGDHGMSVPFTKQRIKNGPDIDADGHLSKAQIAELRHYYGAGQTADPVPDQRAMPQPDQAGHTDQAGNAGQAGHAGQAGQDGRAGQAGQDGRARERSEARKMGEADGRMGREQAAAGERGRDADGWLTRAEERLTMGTEVHESGRVRLHKYVDAEPVEQQVHLYHEEVELEREPITDVERAAGLQIGEDERELILHEERAVITREVVPVERVRLRAKRTEEDRTIREEVRKERVEVEPVVDDTTPDMGPGLKADMKPDMGAGMKPDMKPEPGRGDGMPPVQ